MRLVVLSAVHGITGGRRDVYNFFCKRMEHIKKKYDVATLVVGSEGEESRKPTEEHGLFYVEHPNRPVSDKWNYGMQQIKKFNPTYVMILGSDDIVSDSLIEEYLDIIKTEDYDIFGIRDSYYFGLNETESLFSQCGYWRGYPNGKIIGYARVFNRRILDRLDWQPWVKGLNSGLDFSVDKRMKEENTTPRELILSVKENNHLHIDIKTKGNISRMKPLKLEEVGFNSLFKEHLPADEANAIIDYAEDFIEGVNSVL